MSFLVTLREQGCRVSIGTGRLVVGPKAALNDAVRMTIRINREAILHELNEEAARRKESIGSARDASVLPEFPKALRSGRLQVCCNCSKFSFAEDLAAPGQCAFLSEAVRPFVPFPCESFAVSSEPVAPRYLPECAA